MSMQYLGAQTKLRWRCAGGHEWEALPNCVKNDNTWCPYCSGKTKHTIQEMKQLAKNRNGECLSDHYIDAFTKLRWRCARRHQWEAAPSSVKNKGTWCPICGREIAASKVRLGLDEMRQLAKDRGGACLSNTYAKKHGDKLLWRCHEGHEWEASANDIRNSGTWCPYCAGVVKLNLGHMISMAKKYGGECLSTDYINSKTKLRWRCAKGHEWETAPASILKSKRRTWCPYCARKAKLTIEEMQEIAKSRGGDCLSKHYINGSTKLHWRCHLGHECMATPDNIKNNRS